MKKILLYIVLCILVGFLMVFRHTIRQMFAEDLNKPMAADLSWLPPASKQYKQKALLELHFFDPRLPQEVILQKTQELKEKQAGIHTVLLSGSSKIGTNTYIRELAKEDWGIEEIRLHGTKAINIYAFINFIKSAKSSLKRVYVWGSTWDNDTLKKIKGVMPPNCMFQLMNE